MYFSISSIMSTSHTIYSFVHVLINTLPSISHLIQIIHRQGHRGSSFDVCRVSVSYIVARTLSPRPFLFPVPFSCCSSVLLHSLQFRLSVVPSHPVASRNDTKRRSDNSSCLSSVLKSPPLSPISSLGSGYIAHKKIFSLARSFARWLQRFIRRTQKRQDKQYKME